MEQVKNLDDKRVCDKSKDGKVIVIRKKDCLPGLPPMQTERSRLPMSM